YVVHSVTSIRAVEERLNATEIRYLGCSLHSQMQRRGSLCGGATARRRGGRRHLRKGQPTGRHGGPIWAGAAERIRRGTANGSAVQPVSDRAAGVRCKGGGTPRARAAIRSGCLDYRSGRSGGTPFPR